MYDTLALCSAPTEEECVQVGDDDYASKARKECRALINQLERQFGTHDSAHFAIKSNYHDYGTYYDVVVEYDSSVESAVEYAYNIENNLPTNWDDQARSALAQMLAAEVERSDKFIKEMDRHRSVVTSIAAAQAENQRESSNDRERLAKAIDRLAEEQAHLRRSIDSLEGDVETCIHEIRRYQTD